MILATIIPTRQFWENENTFPDPKIANDINKRLGSQYTSWYAIVNYIYYDAALSGSTREEVYQDLSEIGKWEILYSGKPKIHFSDELHNIAVSQEIVQFTDNSSEIALHKWIFLYDAQDTLVDKRVFVLPE